MLARNEAAAALPVDSANAARMRLVDDGAGTIASPVADAAPAVRPVPSRTDVVKLLNDSLANELVCVLRCKRHHFTAAGLAPAAVVDQFLVHATQRSVHADRLARRIVQLGGRPDFSPDSLSWRSHAAYDESSGLQAMIRADLSAARAAIETYALIIALIGDNDRISRRLLEDILHDERAYAAHLEGWVATD